jgi:chemotaxis regulatin CheY-phosphate phosphatase CheZ
MYMCSKSNGAMAKNTAIPQEEEVTDQDINYLISQILSLFSDVLEQAEDADKEVYDKMMARSSQDLIDYITEMIEDRR